MYRFATILKLIVVVVLATTPLSASAQRKSTKVDQQQSIVNKHKRDLDAANSKVKELNGKRGAALEALNALNDKMNLQSNLIAEVEKQREMVEAEMMHADSLADSLSLQLNANIELYKEVIRASYREYRHTNHAAYLFSAGSFSDITRRMTQLKRLAEHQQALVDEIKVQQTQLDVERETVRVRQHEIDSIGLILEEEHSQLERDRKDAQKKYKELTSAQQKALAEQARMQKNYDKEVAELRKLTERNASQRTFTDKSTSLNLPVANGNMKKMSNNTAAIYGKKGSAVRSNFEGEVLSIEQDRTNHKKVVIANDTYISAYSRLATTNVKVGDVVKRDQQIGTEGIAYDHTGKEEAYIQFTLIYRKSDKDIDLNSFFKR